MKRISSITWFKVAVFLLSLAPAIYLTWAVFHDRLGRNPIQEITYETGDWTMIFIMATLSITPLRKITKFQPLIKTRRMVGLFTFFYGCLHFTTYLWLDKFFDLPEMVKDIGMRPFITAGFLAFALMIPLAITSTAGWIRRLGGKRWQLLHRLIYITGIAGVIHYYWLVKSDIRLPLLYASILTILLGFRYIVHLRELRATKSKAAATPLRSQVPIHQ